MGDSSDRIDVKLDGSNYSLWKLSAMAALVYRDLFEHVEGLCPCPGALKSDSSDQVAKRAAEIRAWKVADRKAWTIIFGSIDPALRPRFSNIVEAKSLWDQLAEMFTQTGDIRVYQLEQEVYSATQGSRSIRDFYNYMHSLWSQLDILAPILRPSCLNYTRCPSTRLQTQDRHRLHSFLMKLGSPYEGVRSQLLHRSPRPSLLDAVKELQSEETRLGLLSSSAVPDSTAILAALPHVPPIVLAAPPRPSPTRGPRRLSCTYCHRPGHDESHCWKKRNASRLSASPRVTTASPISQPITLVSPSTDDRIAALETQLARLSPSLPRSFPDSRYFYISLIAGSTAAAYSTFG
ncbi:uncharacterized protein LOC130140020 [Syzygium oleosum]|uniref:uncharacterized protein LOC130140020 n=1 Tax=Syzygium oleosum TaxID=219896 RepID=UPI0024B9C15A|nr:uncharacterized protein LOC130140020 [Syzygium oleosum]